MVSSSLIEASSAGCFSVAEPTAELVTDDDPVEPVAGAVLVPFAEEEPARDGCS